MWSYRNHFKKLFGTAYEAEASLAHISFENKDSSTITVNRDIGVSDVLHQTNDLVYPLSMVLM